MRWLWLAALLGCAGARPPAAPLQPLGEAVAFTEVTSDGEHRPIVPGGVSEVDLNSRIEIHVDRARVEQLIAAASQADPAETVRIRSRLADLSRLTRGQQGAIERLSELAARWEQEGRPPTPSPALQEATALFNADRLALNTAIGNYAVAAGQEKAVYFSGAAGGLQATWRALDDERRRVLDEAARLAQRTAGLRWRMQAVFARGTPIHLANYDSYPDGPFALIDKWRPTTTAQGVAAQLDEAKQLAKDLKSLASAKQAFATAAVERIAPLVAAVKPALEADLAALADELPQAVTRLKEGKAIKAELPPLAEALTTLRAACAPVIDALEAHDLRALPSEAAGRCMRAVLRDGRALISRARAAGDAARALRALAERLPAKVSAQLQALGPRLEAAQRVEAVVGEVAKGWDQLARILELEAQVVDAPVFADDRQTDHGPGDVTDTVLDLRRTERKDGELFHVRPSIVSADGAAAVLGATADFRAVRMGMYIDVSAGVAFLDPRDGAWGPFTAAPGVVAALHHRWRPGSAVGRALNALRPGLGIHFLYPDLGEQRVDAAGNEIGSDPSFELGVGGSVLLFGDLLQVGAGYDLQVGTSYWYLGFGLDTLARLGVRFSPGG